MYSVKEIFYTLQGEGARSGRAAVFLRFAGCNLWSGREEDRAGAICRFCDTDFVGTNGGGGGKFARAEALAKAVARAWPFRDGTLSQADGIGVRPLGAITRARSPSWPGFDPATQGHKFQLSQATLGGRIKSGHDENGPLSYNNEAPAGMLAPVGVCPYVVCTGGEPLLQLDASLIEALHAVGFEIAIETNGTIAAPPGVDWICVSPKGGADLVQTFGHEMKLVYPQENVDPAAYAGLSFEHFFLQPMDGPDRVANTERAASYCLAHPRWRLSLQMHKAVGIQ